MRAFITFTIALLTLAGLEFAVMASAPRLRSDCSEALTGSWLQVLIGLLIYTGLGLVAVRRSQRSAYVLLVGTALILLVNDWVTQEGLKDLTRNNCKLTIIR